MIIKIYHKCGHTQEHDIALAILDKEALRREKRVCHSCWKRSPETSKFKKMP